MTHVAYTTGPAVAELIKTGRAGSYAIVDVRGALLSFSAVSRPKTRVQTMTMWCVQPAYNLRQADTDEQGGNIKGVRCDSSAPAHYLDIRVQARNVPSAVFDDSLSSLIEDYKDVRRRKVILRAFRSAETAQRDTVIFHCALSQQRGPKAARKYAEAMAGGRIERTGPGIEQPPTLSKAEELPDATQTKEQQVLVLRGGFVQFADRYKVRSFSGTFSGRYSVKHRTTLIWSKTTMRGWRPCWACNIAR